MRTIDLKWALPLVMPFVVLGLVRVLWWVSGAPWTEPAMAATFSLVFGAGFGVLFAFLLSENGIHWRVTIGRKD